MIKIYQLLFNNFGNTDHIHICGSVAKILHGILPEHYIPKDIDLLVSHPYWWRFLFANIVHHFSNVEIEEYRIKIWEENNLVEIWRESVDADLVGIKNNFTYKIKL